MGFNMRRVGEAEKWAEAAELALEKNWNHAFHRSRREKQKALVKEVGAKGEPGVDNRFGTKGVRASEFRLECERQKFSD